MTKLATPTPWRKLTLLTLIIFAFAGTVVSSTVLTNPTVAYAQEEGGGADGESTNLLVQMYEALGLVFGFIFLALSISLVALVVMNLIKVRRDAMMPQMLIDTFNELIEQQQYQEAYELVAADESQLGLLLAAGLAKANAGFDPAMEAMNEVLDEETLKLEHMLSYIALIGSVAPMLGLLGTVYGMISAFGTMASSSTAPDTKELAKDIGTALWTTMMGLCLSIPAMGVFSILKNRLQKLGLELQLFSEGIMKQVVGGGAK